MKGRGRSARAQKRLGAPGAWMRSSRGLAITAAHGNTDQSLEQDRPLADVPGHGISGLKPVDRLVDLAVNDGEPCLEGDQPDERPHVLDLGKQ